MIHFIPESPDEASELPATEALGPYAEAVARLASIRQALACVEQFSGEAQSDSMAEAKLAAAWPGASAAAQRVYDARSTRTAAAAASVPCPASQEYSKAYLHHLIRADEILGKVLLSWHNIAFFQALTAAMREAIAGGRFDQFRRDFHARHVSNGGS